MQTNSESILVCLSPAPSNRMIIQAAADMRRDETIRLVALFIETPGYESLSQVDKSRLRDNIEYARRIGAQIEVVVGDDIPFQIAEYARHANIRRIVIGQSITSGNRLFQNPNFSENLLRYLPDAELHVIPDGNRRASYRQPEEERFDPRRNGRDLCVSLLVLTAATLLGELFNRLGFSDSNIMMAYLLGVLLIAIGTTHRGYSLVSAAAAVLLFNYFFVQPRFSLQYFEAGYLFTFLVMFLTSFITGTLAVRLKSSARQAARSSYRTKIISDTDRLLAMAGTREEILEVCSLQVHKLLEQPFELLEPDAAEADGARFERFPVQVQDRVYAVLQVDTEKQPLEISETGILLSILGECALALENERNAREKEEAARQVENERLRSTLLRAISHDLRTPLTSISGNASTLISHGAAFDEETRLGLYRSIYDDSIWLSNMVENLLASSRLENGEANLRFTTEVLEDIIEEAVAHVRSFSDEHRIVAEPSEELLLVRADARLIILVLVNLLNNAVKYTQPGSTITVGAKRDGSVISVTVSDDGPGIPDEDKEKVFDMFYTSSSSISDGRRSLGFGLALCKTIIGAHGGEIRVEDNTPHGSVFIFTLQAEEVPLDG